MSRRFDQLSPLDLLAAAWALVGALALRWAWARRGDQNLWTEWDDEETS